jgi:hypothetical protein
VETRGRFFAGASQVDNVGTSCVDVYYYIPGTANEVSCVDIPMLGEGSSTHEYDPNTLAQMAFDDDLSTGWWETKAFLEPFL